MNPVGFLLVLALYSVIARLFYARFRRIGPLWEGFIGATVAWLWLVTWPLALWDPRRL